jgi:hypothetical protein
MPLTKYYVDIINWAVLPLMSLRVCVRVPTGRLIVTLISSISTRAYGLGRPDGIVVRNPTWLETHTYGMYLTHSRENVTKPLWR